MHGKLVRLGLSPLVVALLGLLVVAAGASGAVWKKEGKNLASFAELKLSGEVGFIVFPNKLVGCSLSATITTEGGSVGKMTKFGSEKCEGAGKWAGCEVSVASVFFGVPWPIQVTGELDLFVEKPRFKFTVGGSCAKETVERKANSTWWPDNSAAIGGFAFESVAGELEYLGVVSVNPAGVYGLG